MIIRPFKDEDAIQIAKWIKTKEDMYLWSGGHLTSFPILPKDILDFYDKQKKEYSETVFLSACDDDYCLEGHLFISVDSQNKKHPRIRFVIVDPDKRGIGVGTEMLRLAGHYAFCFLNVEDLSLAYVAENEYAGKSYEKAGYIKNGELSKRIMNNKEYTLVEMILKKDITAKKI